MPSCGNPSFASRTSTKSAANQRAFGRLLHHCSCCSTATEILTGIRTIDQLRIKGLGPAVANLIYFLHPTHVSPFNTAIVNGYNAITGSKVKLGSWEHYLAMRQGILALNARYSDLLSNDLGAIAGFLFDVGSGRYPAPPLDGESLSASGWDARLAEARAEAVKFEKAALRQRETDRTHTEIQGWVRDLGRALGYRVWIASNDRGRQHEGARLSEGCLEHLPPSLANGPGAESIRLIDVLWLEGDTDRVAAAFEVEHSTTIYSGVVRMLDLAPVRRTEHLRRPLPGRSRQPRKRCEGAVATSGLQPDRRSQCALSALRRTGTASGVYRPLRNRSQGSDRDFAPGDLIVSTRTVSHPGRSSSYARSARARSSSRTRQAISMAFSAVNTTAIQTWPKTSGRMAISRDATQ